MNDRRVEASGQHFNGVVLLTILSKSSDLQRELDEPI